MQRVVGLVLMTTFIAACGGQNSSNGDGANTSATQVTGGGINFFVCNITDSDSPFEAINVMTYTPRPEASPVLRLDVIGKDEAVERFDQTRAADTLSPGVARAHFSGRGRSFVTTFHIGEYWLQFEEKGKPEQKFSCGQNRRNIEETRDTTLSSILHSQKWCKKYHQLEKKEISFFPNGTIKAWDYSYDGSTGFYNKLKSEKSGTWKLSLKGLTVTFPGESKFYEGAYKSSWDRLYTLIFLPRAADLAEWEEC